MRKKRETITIDCWGCNGSGEGMADVLRCLICGGSGDLESEEETE